MNIWPWSRIRELEAERDRLHANLRNESDQHRTEEAALRNECNAAKNQVEYLVRTIRDMDEQLFKISQNADGTWTRVQPNFKTLCDGMTARKVAESNRISDILRPQLIETYNDRTNVPKRIGRSDA